MKVKDIIKKQTTVIAIAVALVAITAIGVSYAIFFDVKKNKDNQVITAGTLKLTVSGVKALNLSTPTDDTKGIQTTGVSYTVSNTNSSLPATYKLYIYPAANNGVELSTIKISLDGNINNVKFLSAITKETININGNNKDCYLIDSGDLLAKTNGTTKNIKVWLDEDAIKTPINKNVGLQMYIVSEVKE